MHLAAADESTGVWPDGSGNTRRPRSPCHRWSAARRSPSWPDTSHPPQPPGAHPIRSNVTRFTSSTASACRPDRRTARGSGPGSPSGRSRRNCRAGNGSGRGVRARAINGDALAIAREVNQRAYGCNRVGGGPISEHHGALRGGASSALSFPVPRYCNADEVVRRWGVCLPSSAAS